LGDLNRRLRRLEQEANMVPDSCPECGNRIIFEEVALDGTVSYPDGPPCSECGSRAAGGRIGTIVIATLDPDDPPTDVYQLEYETLDESRGDRL
jgi:hypothetical protein